MKSKKLESLKPTHDVDFFDSFTMSNQTAPCIVERIAYGVEPHDADIATCRILGGPVMKTVRVPLTCLVDRATGQRLPYTSEFADS